MAAPGMRTKTKAARARGVPAPREHEPPPDDGAEEQDIDASFQRSGVGSYIRSARGDLLTAEQERSLAQRKDSGDREARETMIVRNLRLVIHNAKKFQGRGLTLDDLIGEGNAGLIHAVDLYNWKKGYRFSTYATWWICQAMQRSLRLVTSIKVPPNVYDMATQIEGASRAFRDATGVSPSLQDLAGALQLPVNKIKRYACAVAARDVRSLDAPLSDDEDSDSLVEITADPFCSTSAELSLFRDEVIAAVEKLLSRREARVVLDRFGLRDGIRRTLTEVAVVLGVSRERVRQIQTEAMEKLRTNMELRPALYPILSRECLRPGNGDGMRDNGRANKTVRGGGDGAAKRGATPSGGRRNNSQKSKTRRGNG